MIRVALLLAVVLVFGACRKYEVDIPLQPSNVVGSWILSSAPSKVMSSIPVGEGAAGLTINADGTANYNSFPIPIGLIQGANPSRTSKWTFSTGDGFWTLTDEGGLNQHVWHLRLQTDKIGVQLTVGEESSGDLILLFNPDANSNDALVFRRNN